MVKEIVFLGIQGGPNYSNIYNPMWDDYFEARVFRFSFGITTEFILKKDKVSLNTGVFYNSSGNAIQPKLHYSPSLISH